MPEARWVVSYAICSKFHTLSSNAKNWESIEIWQSYRKFKSGNFFETQCIGLLHIVCLLLQWHIESCSTARLTSCSFIYCYCIEQVDVIVFCPLCGCYFIYACMYLLLLHFIRTASVWQILLVWPIVGFQINFCSPMSCTFSLMSVKSCISYTRFTCISRK